MCKHEWLDCALFLRPLRLSSEPHCEGDDQPFTCRVSSRSWASSGFRHFTKSNMHLA